MTQPRALEVLRREHRQMGKLLDLLERQINLVVQDCEPDYELLLGIAGYFRSFPDLYHHPKEDLIVRRLTMRNPMRAKPLLDLEAEHEEGSRKLARFSRALVDFIVEPALGRDRFIDMSQSFLTNERGHIAWERQNFFDAVEANLAAEDWAEIDALCRRLDGSGVEREARSRRAGLDGEIAGWRNPAAG